jgi:hypothetical protein
MGNTESGDIREEVQIFYETDGETQDMDFPLDTWTDKVPWEHDACLHKNEMLWSYAANNRIVVFMHLRRETDPTNLCDLRDCVVNPPPMRKDEYTRPENHYCVCMAYDFGRSAFVQLGFILYRVYEKKIYLLDIVFYIDQLYWDTEFPELKNINIPLTCINAFDKFVRDVGYPCVWRKSLLLDRVFRRSIATYRKHVYNSVGLQRKQIGSRTRINMMK